MQNSKNNPSRKNYYAPMHTAEHILNQTMVRMFDCGRSFNAHIERKKSKCDYNLPFALNAEQIKKIEKTVNEIIKQNLPINEEFMPIKKAAQLVDLSKLPNNAPEVLRIVRIGDYDVCACIGEHVKNTSEVGVFKITTTSHKNGVLRIRYKLI